MKTNTAEFRFGGLAEPAVEFGFWMAEIRPITNFPTRRTERRQLEEKKLDEKKNDA